MKKHFNDSFKKLQIEIQKYREKQILRKRATAKQNFVYL